MWTDFRAAPSSPPKPRSVTAPAQASSSRSPSSAVRFAFGTWCGRPLSGQDLSGSRRSAGKTPVAAGVPAGPRSAPCRCDQCATTSTCHYLELASRRPTATHSGADARLPPVLRIVRHTGRSQWHALSRVHDLVAGACHEKSWQQPNVYSPDSGLLCGPELSGAPWWTYDALSAKDFTSTTCGMSLLAQLTASIRVKGPATPEDFRRGCTPHLPATEPRGMQAR